ncbi:MAG: potassium/proton antiporter, partial [Hyphomicrobiaceae bacterium]
QLFVVASALLLLSILASKLSARLGVPALLFFLGLGMLAGADGPGGICFDDFRIAQAVGSIALVFILFSGGLDTNWQYVRPILGPGIALSTAGVLLAALFAGAFAHLVLGLSLLQGILLGAIVSATDAAAVLALLRSGALRLRGQLAPLLEFESGSNDPMAVFLTLGAIELLIQPGTSISELGLRFVVQMTLGGAFGWGIGRAAVILINRLRLTFDGLYTVFTIATVLAVYGASELAGGNGFLAAYVAGIVMGNHNFVHKRSLLHFHDGLSWVMQITMFLILGLLVFPSQLPAVAGVALLFTAFMILVGRPLSLLLTLLPVRLRLGDKAFLSWAGLRGAAPIVLATFPALAGVPQAENIFNIVFFVVLASVLVQGTTTRLAARVLGVEAPKPAEVPVEDEHLVDLARELREIILPSTSVAMGHTLVELNLPPGFLVVLVHRDGESLVPNGDTVLRAGDHLLVLAEPVLFEETAGRLSEPRDG